MVVEFWSLSKRVNSTKQPDGGGQQLNVMLKQAESSGSFGFSDSSFDTAADHSQLSPTFALNWDTGKFPFNYCHCWGCYYFIDDVQYGINNLVFVRCKIDVLATYKSSILATTAKVLYSSSNYDLNIDDKRNALTERVQTTRANSPFNISECTFGGYMYLLNAMNAKDGISNYVLDSGQFGSLCNKLMTDTAFQEDLAEYFLAPVDSIVQVRLAPFYWGHNMQGEEIYLGNMGTGITARNPLRVTTLSIYTIVSIPKLYNDYRDGERCASYQISIPFCGTQPIDPGVAYSAGTLTVKGELDLCTGDIQGVIHPGTVDETETGSIMTTFSGNAYSSVPIGQIITPSNATLATLPQIYMSALSGASSGAALGSGGGKLGAGLGAIAGIGYSILNGMESGAEQATARSKVIGSTSGLTGKFNSNYDWTSNTAYVTVSRTGNIACDAPSAIVNTLGLPCNKTLLLSGLTGFCQTSGASVSIAATDQEILAVNQMLDAGIFIE